MYTCNRNSLHKHEKGDDDLIPGLNNYNIIKIRCLLYLFPFGYTPTCNSILFGVMSLTFHSSCLFGVMSLTFHSSLIVQSYARQS